jgi:hypothetical protein
MPADPSAEGFLDVMTALVRVVVMHMPIWIALGVALAVFGRRLRCRMPGAAEGVAALWLAIAFELVAYSVDGMRNYAPVFFREWSRATAPFLPNLEKAVDVGVAAMTALMIVPLLVLCVLSWRQRNAR